MHSGYFFRQNNGFISSLYEIEVLSRSMDTLCPSCFRLQTSFQTMIKCPYDGLHQRERSLLLGSHVEAVSFPCNWFNWGSLKPQHTALLYCFERGIQVFYFYVCKKWCFILQSVLLADCPLVLINFCQPINITESTGSSWCYWVFRAISLATKNGWWIGVWDFEVKIIFHWTPIAVSLVLSLEGKNFKSNRPDLPSCL